MGGYLVRQWRGPPTFPAQRRLLLLVTPPRRWLVIGLALLPGGVGREWSVLRLYNTTRNRLAVAEQKLHIRDDVCVYIKKLNLEHRINLVIDSAAFNRHFLRPLKHRGGSEWARTTRRNKDFRWTFIILNNLSSHLSLVHSKKKKPLKVKDRLHWKSLFLLWGSKETEYKKCLLPTFKSTAFSK